MNIEQMYRKDRTALLADILEWRAKPVGTAKREMYLENMRLAMIGIRSQRYAKPGSRLHRLRDR